MVLMITIGARRLYKKQNEGRRYSSNPGSETVIYALLLLILSHFRVPYVNKDLCINIHRTNLFLNILSCFKEYFFCKTYLMYCPLALHRSCTYFIFVYNVNGQTVHRQSILALIKKAYLNSYSFQYSLNCLLDKNVYCLS